MSEVISAIIERDTYDSILYSVLGGLLILSTYHFVLYIQNQNKSYLLYSSYTFFSFLAYMPVTNSGFLFSLSSYLHFDHYSKQLFTIIFNSIYFLFFAQFLNVKKTSLTFYRIIVSPIYVLISFVIIAFILLKTGISMYSFELFSRLFIYLITVHTILSFYILTKVKNKLKYYIIFGGIILYFCSILGEQTIRQLPAINISKKMGDFIYFTGLIIENIAFSFALGHRQRITYQEKVSFNKNLIVEMQKNVKLKDKINLQYQKRLEVENDRIKYQRENSDLKLSILQNQMNPHFIFNALNSIKYYILENDTENAVDYLTKFSKIIRTILVSSTVKEFTLEEELQTIKVYVDIENLRFHKKIDYSVYIDPDIHLNHVKLPPMILQPYIENAIIHGVSLLENKKIVLEILSKNEVIEIRITDNGIGRAEAAKNRDRHKNLGKSLGTKITDNMLKNYFGPKNYSINYYDLADNNQPAGTRVVLEIPSRSFLDF